ncbi:MAG: ABC transporter permease [Nitrososphaerales archaeon]|nr:ABC transporter permease [Nitrososphaerales archaeon]
MKAIRILKFAWGAMKNRKLRAILTILGITIGPAVIVALVGATQGFAANVTERFNKLGITTLFVMPSMRSGLRIDDTVVKTISQIPGVESAVPYYNIRATIRSGGQTKDVTILALDVSKLKSILPGISLGEGEYPTALSQAIIGTNIAYPQDGSPGVTVNNVISTTINTRVGTRIVRVSRAFVVSGILKPFGQSFFINPDDTIFVPMSVGKSLTGSQTYSGVYVVARTIDDVSNIQSTISDLYGGRVRVIAISSLLSNIQSVNENISMILVSIAFMSVIVAFIGIMTTMFTSVHERTKEIGILKSLGYSPKDILSIFLAEATLTGAIGGLVGITLGSFLSFAIVGMLGGGGLGLGFPGFRPPGQAAATQASVITPVITPELLIGTFLMAVVIGALAGLLPSWRASRMVPVVALRHE